jgi:hypothetical protein
VVLKSHSKSRKKAVLFATSFKLFECYFVLGFDVTKCMFSSGNVSEKLRMSQLSCRDQVIFDFFAGIGYASNGGVSFTGAGSQRNEI